MTKGGNTVNLCAIDLSKAFDKVNHHALLLKLMKRNIPITLLDLLEYWLNNCFCCCCRFLCMVCTAYFNMTIVAVVKGCCVVHTYT